VPIIKRLKPEPLEDGWAEVWAVRSDAGNGGMLVICAVVVELPVLSAPAAPPWDVCPGEELGGTTVAPFVTVPPEPAEPTAYGINWLCVWAVTTMLRLVCGGRSRAVALS
jgi:hypothetical protein